VTCPWGGTVAGRIVGVGDGGRPVDGDMLTVGEDGWLESTGRRRVEADVVGDDGRRRLRQRQVPETMAARGEEA